MRAGSPSCAHDARVSVRRSGGAVTLRAARRAGRGVRGGLQRGLDARGRAGPAHPARGGARALRRVDARHARARPDDRRATRPRRRLRPPLPGGGRVLRGRARASSGCPPSRVSAARPSSRWRSAPGWRTMRVVALAGHRVGTVSRSWATSSTTTPARSGDIRPSRTPQPPSGRASVRRAWRPPRTPARHHPSLALLGIHCGPRDGAIGGGVAAAAAFRTAKGSPIRAQPFAIETVQRDSRRLSRVNALHLGVTTGSFALGCRRRLRAPSRLMCAGRGAGAAVLFAAATAMRAGCGPGARADRKPMQLESGHFHSRRRRRDE